MSGSRSLGGAEENWALDTLIRYQRTRTEETPNLQAANLLVNQLSFIFDSVSLLLSHCKEMETFLSHFLC